MTTKRRSATTPRSRRRTRRPPISLLVLELDAAKIRRQGLSYSDQASFFGAMIPGAVVKVIQAATREQLEMELEVLAERKTSFDVVMAIGHSNDESICAGADAPSVTWSEFAALVRPFEPRRLVLVACDAGRWPAARVLFRKLPTLRRIFASPVPASKRFAQLMVVLVPYVMMVKLPPPELITTLQATLAAIDGGQLRHWLRKDASDSSGVLLDVAAQVLNPALRQLPKALASLFRGA